MRTLSCFIALLNGWERTDKKQTNQESPAEQIPVLKEG